MNKKQRSDLDIISRIDDEIIEKNTKKRVALLNKKRSPRWVIPSGVAAAIVVCILVPVLIFMFAKQVPIYEGMTVSKHKPTSSAENIMPESGRYSFDFLSGTNNGNGNDGDNGNHFGQNKKPIEDIVEEDTSISLEIPEQQMYYANPGQDIYITVHISNPDSFEILSFTLNGKKYSSYMFEQGSDMENLILKVNVGNEPGIREYTIDAIKYVDGTEIKDVDMRGERTVKVGIYSAGIQPTVQITDEIVGINEISFKVDLTDSYKLIERSDGKVFAGVYSEDKLIAYKEIEAGENSVTFDGLDTYTSYRYGVVAYYDALDGNQMDVHTLYEKDFTTQSVVAPNNVQIDKTSISFGLTFSEMFTSKKLTSLTLYHGEDKVKDFDVSGDLTTKTFTAAELLSNNKYRLVIAYENLGATETVEFELSTQAKETPDFTVTETENTQTSFKFDIAITDVDAVGAITKIELIHGEDVTNVEDLTTRELTNLLSNNDYTLKVTYTYDLNDGVGNQTLVKELAVKTEAKATPDLTVTETEKTQTSFKFDITITDVDAVGAITKIELIHGEDVTNIEDLTALEITNLLSNNDYTVKVTYTYDLNDGVGNQTLVKELAVKTEEKATPDLTVTETEKTQTSFKFDISITDIDAVGAITKIELIHGEDVTSVEDLTTRELTNLLSNNDYTVKVTYTYDLNDGVGEHIIEKTLDVKTEAKATPDFTITETEKTQTSFKFDIAITDVDAVGAITKIELIHGEDVTNVEDLTARELTDLLSNNDYTVKVTYTYDLNDGVGNQTLVKELAVKTEEKVEPTFTIKDVTSDTYTVSGAYDQTNADNTLISYTVKLFKGDELVKENTDKKIKFDSLDYYTDYTVKITYTFDVNDGRGVQTKTVEQSIKTLPYVDVESIVSRNDTALFDGDTIYVQANIINPNGVNVTHIDINGKKYAVSSASTATRLFVEMVCDQTLGGGNVELKIDRIYANLEDTSYEIGIDSEASATVFVNTPLELLNVEFVNESYETIYWRFPDKKYYVKFTVNNLAGYEITKITMGSREIDSSQLIKISDSEYVFDADSLTSGWVIYSERVVTIYGDNQYVSNSSDTFEFTQNFVTLQSNEIKYISTADEFIEALYECGDVEWSHYYYKLTADIDLSGKSWDIRNFCGVIDGDGHSIKNYTITGYARNFGLICELYGGIINVNMENAFVMVNNSTDVDMMAGMFAMWNRGLIQNCTINNNTVISVTGMVDAYVGGFAGRNYGTIENCTNNANVSASIRYGAIALDGNGTIKNCVNNGDISCGVSYGIAGRGTIQDCINNGSFENCNMAFGIADNATIQNCINNGDILNCGSSYGIARGGTLENCDNYGMIRTCDRLEERTTLIGVGGDTNRNCNNYGDLIYVTSEPQWYEEDEIPSLFDSFGEDVENCNDYGAHYFNDKVIKDATTPPKK